MEAWKPQRKSSPGLLATLRTCEVADRAVIAANWNRTPLLSGDSSQISASSSTILTNFIKAAAYLERRPQHLLQALGPLLCTESSQMWPRAAHKSSLPFGLDGCWTTGTGPKLDQLFVLIRTQDRLTVHQQDQIDHVTSTSTMSDLNLRRRTVVDLPGTGLAQKADSMCLLYGSYYTAAVARDKIAEAKLPKVHRDNLSM